MVSHRPKYEAAGVNRSKVEVVGVVKGVEAVVVVVEEIEAAIGQAVYQQRRVRAVGEGWGVRKRGDEQSVQ